MHEIELVINIAGALLVAFAGGLIARRIGLPAIAGYLLAGVAIGPFTPGWVGDVEAIGQLAELGVIFLMFGVGLHFSLRDLWAVRDIAIPGALGQMLLATALGFGLSQLWGWPVASGLVLGLAISIASTVVLLRGLMDNGLLNTRHGQVAVGWLVLEDIATVLILVVLPALAPAGEAAVLPVIGLTLFKAALFIVLMLFVGVRLVPWVLHHIVHLRSRELFILAVLAAALGIAVGAAELFGVSLALGAFLAGVVVNESRVSHQAAAEVLPFRDIFTVLFFVSVGMLVNPAYLLANAGHVIALTGLIVLGKAAIAALIGFLFPHPARTALTVAAGLSQIGEFSFIVGQAGLGLGLLDQDQYSLILAGAMISIMLNPLMFRAIAPVEAALKRSPRLWRRLDRHGPAPPAAGETLAGHVVVVGYGRVGRHIVDVLGRLNTPRLVVEADPSRLDELQRLGVPSLFGDAANSDLLQHTGLEQARALVVTLPDEASTEMVVAAARQMRPTLPVIARAATEAGVRRLAQLGAGDVIHPELEGGLEIVRHTLLRLGLPAGDVQGYADAVRRDQYDQAVDTDEEHRLLHQMVEAARGIEIAWLKLMDGSSLAGQTLAEANIRARTGASVVAIVRAGQLLPNPKSMTILQPADLLGLIGETPQLEAASRLLGAADRPPESTVAQAAVDDAEARNDEEGLIA
jgi:CPA2 family monovalent cation:H+ antiporter-2